MSSLTKKLAESVIRTQLDALNQRLAEANRLPQQRLRRMRARLIRQDFGKLERLAKKWGVV